MCYVFNWTWNFQTWITYKIVYQAVDIILLSWIALLFEYETESNSTKPQGK